MTLVVSLVGVAAVVVGSWFIVSFLILGNTRSPYGQSMMASSATLVLIGIAALTWNEWVILAAICAHILVIAHRLFLLVTVNHLRPPTNDLDSSEADMDADAS